jgi:sterol carrier protein 2
LISKGHPLGATGLAQCAELVWQLRGWANNRLVNDVSVALQHNLGLGGAVVVTIYKRADKKNSRVSDSEVVKKSQFEYNPAVEARGVSAVDGDKVRSRTTRNQWAMGDTEQKIGARL